MVGFVGENKDWEPVEIISFYKVFSVPFGCCCFHHQKVPERRDFDSEPAVCCYNPKACKEYWK